MPTGAWVGVVTAAVQVVGLRAADAAVSWLQTWVSVGRRLAQPRAEWPAQWPAQWPAHRPARLARRHPAVTRDEIAATIMFFLVPAFGRPSVQDGPNDGSG